MRTTSHPILFPQTMTALIAEIVTEIGGLKDQAETEIQFSEALDAIHASEDQKSQVLSRLNPEATGKPVNHRQIAKDYEAKINSTKLISKFAKWLREHNLK